MTRDQLLKPKTITIDLPGGGSVKARKLKQTELEAAIKDLQKWKDDAEQVFARTSELIAAHLQGDDGEPMFTDPTQVGDMDPDDIRAVLHKLIGVTSQEIAAAAE